MWEDDAFQGDSVYFATAAPRKHPRSIQNLFVGGEIGRTDTTYRSQTLSSSPSYRIQNFYRRWWKKFDAVRSDTCPPRCLIF